MAAERTPFLSDPVHGLVNQAHLKTCEPQHDVEALVHMSKLQQALWIDYLGKPWGTHYNLVLRIDFGEGPPESGHLIQGMFEISNRSSSLGPRQASFLSSMILPPPSLSICSDTTTYKTASILEIYIPPSYRHELSIRLLYGNLPSWQVFCKH